MNFCRFYVKHFGLLFFIFLSSIYTNGQSTSHELWPETDIWYRLNPSWRFSSFIAITRYYESKNRDLNITAQADYAWGHAKNPFFGRLQDENRAQVLKTWLLRGGFMRGQSLSDHGENYSEYVALTEIHKRIPIKREWLMSLRLRTDLRWIGQSADFSYRIRYRMMIEKEFKSGKSSIVPYINAEPFWDSRYSIVNRVRLIGGATFAWGKLFAFESNFTYQYDSKSAIENVYALNIILHIFFERKSTKAKPESGELPWFDFAGK